MFLQRYQAWLFYPMRTTLFVFLARFSDIYYFKKTFNKGMLWQIIIFAVGIIIWYVLPFFVFDISKVLLLLVVVSIATGVYLTNIFAPNHKGMEMIEKEKKISFLEQQIITSRNISGNTFNDFVFLGLNYQIEHHLFPNCPRNKLHLITPYVLKICKKYKLSYTVTGFIESNRIIISELNRIARTSKASS